MKIQKNYIYHITYTEQTEINNTYSWESVSLCSEVDTTDATWHDFRFIDLETIVGAYEKGNVWESSIEELQTDKYTIIEKGHKDDYPEYFL